MKVQTILVYLSVTLSAISCGSRSEQSQSKAAVEISDVAVPVTVRNPLVCNTQPINGQEPSTLSFGPSCTELVSKFPAITDTEVKEDKRVLCPFLRLVNRSKLLVENISENSQIVALKSLFLPVTISSLIGATEKFGCNATSCGNVAVLVSAGQAGKSPQSVTPNDVVDIGNLSTAQGVAHDCGYTFAYGDTSVSDATRAETLSLFAARAVDGRLSFKDLMEMKHAMCKRDFLLSNNATLPVKNALSPEKDTLVPSVADLTEVNLIFGYLGGVDNGYILYSDLERFFHAEMPANKTKYVIQSQLFDHLKAVLTGALTK